MIVKGEGFNSPQLHFLYNYSYKKCFNKDDEEDWVDDDYTITEWGTTKNGNHEREKNIFRKELINNEEKWIKQNWTI
jgi:hypothetical protein